MNIEAFQEFLTYFLVRSTTEEDSFRHDHTRTSTLGEVGHDVLQEQAFCSAGVNTEVGLESLVHLAAIGRIGQDYIVLCFFPNYMEIFDYCYHHKRLDVELHGYKVRMEVSNRLAVKTKLGAGAGSMPAAALSSTRGGACIIQGS